jgi:anti-sigma factor RsiW
MNHDDVASLLGAYALDATDEDETAAVADHVAQCPRCAAEVAEHHEVIGLIANVGTDAPAELWDRIAARIAGSGQGERAPAPLALVSGTPRRAPVTARRRRLGWSAAGAVAAAAAAVISLLAVQVGRLDDRVSQLAAAGAQQGLAQSVLHAVVDPHTRTVTLTSPSGGGHAVAELLVLPNGSSYALNTHLPRLAADRTYQLWGFVRGQAVSLGLLGSHPSYVAFSVDPSAPVSSFAVTDEASGGAAHPTRAPVADSTSTT